MTDFYDKINHKLTQHDMLKKEHVIELNRINESSNMAVYQTIRETNDDENMKIQVIENNSLVKIYLYYNYTFYSSRLMKYMKCY